MRYGAPTLTPIADPIVKISVPKSPHDCSPETCSETFRLSKTAKISLQKELSDNSIFMLYIKQAHVSQKKFYFNYKKNNIIYLSPFYFLKTPKASKVYCDQKCQTTSIPYSTPLRPQPAMLRPKPSRELSPAISCTKPAFLLPSPTLLNHRAPGPLRPLRSSIMHAEPAL